MANYYGDPRFDVTLPSTERQVKAVTSSKGLINVSLMSGMPTARVGDMIKLDNCGPWASGTYPLVSKGTSTLVLSKPGLASGKSFTTYLQAVAIRWTAVDGSTQTPGEIEETRKLSTMLKWNDGTVTPTTTMCSMQIRVKDILTQFWSNPEIVRKYQANYNLNSSYWTDFGVQGGYGSTKFINSTMCIAHGSSRWNKYLINAIDKDGVSQAGSVFANQTPEDVLDPDEFSIGLWQIFPENHQAAPWYTTDYSKFIDAEYNTRAMLWMMFKRIFKYDSAAAQNPFRAVPASAWNPVTKAFINTYTKACWGSGCSKCPPYGSATCNQ